MARRLCELARKLYSRYARAAAGILRTFNIGWRYSWIDESSRLLDTALNYARVAVELDQNDACAYGELGFVHLYRKEHDASIDALAHSG